MKNKERDFYFNYGNYLLILKPEIERYFEPKLLIQFGLPLPFYIPFPEKALLSYEVKPGEVCNLMFTSFKDKLKIHIGRYKDEETQVEMVRTRVEMNYVFNKNDFINYNEEILKLKLTETFDKGLSKVNRVIESYIAKTHDEQVHRLSKEHLHPLIIFKVFDPTFNKEIDSGLFTLHMTAPNMNKKPLSISQTDEIMKFIDVIEKHLNPFITGNEFMINANRDMMYGNYSQAIINVQTGIEIFMYSIYREFLKQEGFTISEIKIKSEKMCFKSLIKDQIDKRLGGEFDIRNLDTQVGKWWRFTYLLRNKIVHEGYYPSFEECDDALYYGRDILKYIIELIYETENKNKYPNLLKYIKG